MTEKEIKQRLTKEWPSSQQISPFRIVANPNFTRQLTGIGDIEYINQPVINYPNGFTLINPTGQPTIVYNPNTNGYEDIKLDLLHHYRNDPVYQDLLEEYNKAQKEHSRSNPDDNNIVQDSMWAIKDGIPKQEAWSNAIDGSLRALLYVDDSKLRSDHRYPLSVKESEELYLKTPEVKKSFNNLKTYLQSHVLPEVTVKSKKLIKKKQEGGSLEFSQYAGDPRYRVKYKDLAEDPDYGFYYNSSSNKYIGPGGYHFDAQKVNDPNAIGLWPTKETIESTKTLRDQYKQYMIDNSDKFPTQLGEVEVVGKAPEGVQVQEEKKEEPSYIQKITQSALNPDANKVHEHYIGNPATGDHWTDYATRSIDDRWMAKKLGEDPTGLKSLFGDQRVKTMQMNYKDDYFKNNWNLGQNVLELADLASAGQIKRLSPTQNVRVLYDIAAGKDFPYVLQSLVAGNSGIVSDEFAAEHPYLSMVINGVGDLAAGVAVKPFSMGKIDSYNGLSSNWKVGGVESVVDIVSNPDFVYKIPQKGYRFEFQVPFAVRNKLRANKVPEHVPYEHVKTIKVKNKYYPVYKQQKVIPRELTLDEFEQLQNNINANKGWSASPKYQGASSFDYSVTDYLPDLNVGILKNKPVIYDAHISNHLNPFEQFNTHLTFKPDRTYFPLLSEGITLNNLLNQKDAK